MRIESYEIIPFIKYNDIFLGMTQAEVYSILDECEDIYEEEVESTYEVVLNYRSIGALLSFSSKQNFRLNSISIYHPNSILNGVQFIGKNLKDLTTLCQEAEILDLQLESSPHDIQNRDYYSDDFGLTISIENEIIESITIYPEVDLEDEEMIIWPKTES